MRFKPNLFLKNIKNQRACIMYYNYEILQMLAK